MTKKKEATHQEVLESIDKELADLRAKEKLVREEYIKKVGDRRPTYKDVACPRCKAKKGEHCKAPSGFLATTGHKERHAKIVKKVEAYDKVCNENGVELNRINEAICLLHTEREKVKGKIKKKQEIEQFVESITVTHEKAELVVEKDYYHLTVVKVRNLLGTEPGLTIPSVQAAQALMEKGVDVTIVRKEEQRIGSYPQYAPPFFARM